jgi:hypothetical protein
MEIYLFILRGQPFNLYIPFRSTFRISPFQPFPFKNRWMENNVIQHRCFNSRIPTEMYYFSIFRVFSDFEALISFMILIIYVFWERSIQLYKFNECFKQKFWSLLEWLLKIMWKNYTSLFYLSKYLICFWLNEQIHFKLDWY